MVWPISFLPLMRWNLGNLSARAAALEILELSHPFSPSWNTYFGLAGVTAVVYCFILSSHSWTLCVFPTALSSSCSLCIVHSWAVQVHPWESHRLGWHPYSGGPWGFCLSVCWSSATAGGCAQWYLNSWQPMTPTQLVMVSLVSKIIGWLRCMIHIDSLIW